MRTEVDTANRAARIRRIDRLAWVLDKAIPLPGGFRVGVDGVLGLLPGVGDVSSFAISMYIINEARGLGAPAGLLFKMFWNVLVDTVIGTIPLFGDLFDFYSKANIKNVRLLQDYLSRQDLRVEPLKSEYSEHL